MPTNANTAADVIDNEYQRLQNKKSQLESSTSAQSRAIFLNESYRKRFSRYTQIVLVISIALILYMASLALKKSIPSIPDMALDIPLGIVFAICLIYIIIILLEIASRSNTNYDEIYLLPPASTSTDTVPTTKY